VSDNYWSRDPKRVHHGEHVVAKSVGGVVTIARRRRARGAESTAGDSEHMIRSAKVGRERIEDVRIVVESREKQERTTGATPIEHFQPHVLLDSHEPHGVRERVLASGALSAADLAGRQEADSEA
jgi:hypothetical protein